MWQAAGRSAQDKLVQMLELASHLTHRQWRGQTSPSTGLPLPLTVPLSVQVKRKLFSRVLSQLEPNGTSVPRTPLPRRNTRQVLGT